MAGVGVLGFSGTLPATRMAAPYLGAVEVGLGRAMVACVCGVLLLTFKRSPLPRGSQWPRLFVVTTGVVIGFPWLSAWALQFTSAGRAAVIVALAPLFTALLGSLRERQKPRLSFWLSSVLGSTCVVVYLVSTANAQLASDATVIQAQLGELTFLPELALVTATLFAACGYTEGARLTKELGGLEVISWALLLALPFVLPALWVQAPVSQDIPLSAWCGFAYVSLVSMFGAFYFWYTGLAKAGVVRASQLQLLQPLLSVAWASLLLGEQTTFGLLAAAAGVIASVAWGVRAGRRTTVKSISPLQLENEPAE